MEPMREKFWTILAGQTIPRDLPRNGGLIETSDSWRKIHETTATFYGEDVAHLMDAHERSERRDVYVVCCRVTVSYKQPGRGCRLCQRIEGDRPGAPSPRRPALLRQRRRKHHRRLPGLHRRPATSTPRREAVRARIGSASRRANRAGKGGQAAPETSGQTPPVQVEPIRPSSVMAPRQTRTASLH